MTSLHQESAFFSRHYHDLVGLIYDAVTHEQGFYPFLRRFIDVFNGHSSSFSIYDTQANILLGAWTDVPEHALKFYAEHISHQDALLETALAAAQAGEHRFIASNLDIENIDQVRIDTRVGEWMASFGAHDAAGAITYQSDNYLNFFAVQRSAEQGPFSREELEVFNLFLPHLNRAVALYTEMASLRAGRTEFSALASCSGARSILVCDASSKIVFRNAAAEALLAKDVGIRLNQEDVLSFADARFARLFASSLASTVRASVMEHEADDVLMYYQHDDCRLTLALAPLNAVGDGSHRGGALITLYDWARRPVLEAQRVRQLFGLTAAEARVTSLLAQGYSAVEIATRLERSHQTVRAQLRTVYNKTNTRRQGELVALLVASGAFS